MKKYIKPSIRFNQVHSHDVIATSDPQLINGNADQSQPTLSPNRDSDWANW